MPIAKTKRPPGKINQPLSRSRNWFFLRILAVCLLLIVIFSSLAKLFDYDKPPQKIAGTASLTDRQLQSLSTKDLYTSLDLRVAKLAVYKGAPLIATKDLGVFGDVRQQIIKFPVYSANLVEYGLMTLPLSPAPANGYPVIVLCHGYVNPPRYSTTKAYLSQMEFYSQHGFAVIKPDFRGNGLSVNVGKPEGAFFSMAYNVDLLSLIASIKDTGFLNKDGINLWGHSMGSYIALRAAVLSPDVKKAILLSSPVGSLEEMFKDYTPTSDSSNPVAQLVKSTVLSKYGTPISNPSFWGNASPINFIKQTNTIFQLHVGTADKTVPPEFSAQLNDALTQAHKQHQYYVYPGGNHGLGAEMPLIFSRSLDLLQPKS